MVSDSSVALTRRHALQAVGATTLAALAGCSSTTFSDDASPEYSLRIDSVDASPVDHALYEPDADALFGDSARTALDAILPDGRHTTYGYEPLPDDAYVEHEGAYYRTAHVVTGRETMDRTLVRVDPVPEAEVPEDALLIDRLERPSARVLKILHSYTHTDGGTSTADLLRGDAYVLRRPAELESRLGTGELDGRIVTMTESGTWAYRVDITQERIVETARTALAIDVARSREQFREVVFGSRIDADLAPDALARDVSDLLERTVARGTYSEPAPLSDTFETLLDALGLGAVDTMANGRLLWYDGELYRYALAVSERATAR
ncbi:hypothetical protein [Haloplanus halobius]|uniref:hypothetical protein n=1 Tax=Haloplanus halobius TaxID=2934938 RepID=UPI002010A310|nr:hypothetical protein [Haloplanus sp. XH21]